MDRGREGGRGMEGRRDRGREDEGEVDILREEVGGRKKGCVSGRYFKQTHSNSLYCISSELLQK